MYPYCDTHKYVITLFLQEETLKETPKSADKHVCLCVMCDVTYYMYIYIIYDYIIYIVHIYICTQYVTHKY